MNSFFTSVSSLVQFLPWITTAVLGYLVIRSGSGTIWKNEVEALKQKIDRLEDERRTSTKEILTLKTEVARLKAATDLQSVQAKLDAYMAEQRTFNQELINELKLLVTDINHKLDKVA